MTILYKDLVGKLHEISYKPQKKTKNGGLVVYFKRSATSDDNVRFQLQLMDGQRCSPPFGVSSYENSENQSRMTLDLSIEDEKLVEFAKEFDEHNIKTAIEHKEWFKKDYTEDQIRNMYYPLLIFDETGKGYSPRLHTKINCDGENKANVLIYQFIDGKEQYIPGQVSDIVKYTECMVICEAVGMWFQNKQFGMTLVTTDVIIFPKKKRPEFGFIWPGQAPTRATSDQKEEKEDAFHGSSQSSVLLLPPEPQNTYLLETTNKDGPARKKYKASRYINEESTPSVELL